MEIPKITQIIISMVKYYNNEALDRFKRDHAAVDKDLREKKYQEKMKVYEKRRNHTLER